MIILNNLKLKLNAYFKIFILKGLIKFQNNNILKKLNGTSYVVSTNFNLKYLILILK